MGEVRVTPLSGSGHSPGLFPCQRTELNAVSSAQLDLPSPVPAGDKVNSRGQLSRERISEKYFDPERVGQTIGTTATGSDATTIRSVGA